MKYIDWEGRVDTENTVNVEHRNGNVFKLNLNIIVKMINNEDYHLGSSWVVETVEGELDYPLDKDCYFLVLQELRVLKAEQEYKESISKKIGWLWT